MYSEECRSSFFFLERLVYFPIFQECETLFLFSLGNPSLVYLLQVVCDVVPHAPPPADAGVVAKVPGAAVEQGPARLVEAALLRQRCTRFPA